MVNRNSSLTIEILDDMFNFTWTCRLQEEGIIQITLERWGNYKLISTCSAYPMAIFRINVRALSHKVKCHCSR